MVLAVVAERRNCPFNGRPSTSSDMVCDKSPLATAPITRAISVVGRTRSSISVLTDLTMVAHPPETLGTDARWPRRPSRPTTRLTLVMPSAICSLVSMMSLSVSAIFPASPVQSDGMRAEKSPFLSAFNVASSTLTSRSSAISVFISMTVRPFAIQEAR